MPQRVTDADVKAILDTAIDTQPFIVLASLLVDTHVAPLSVDAALLTEIERWLAAHFACIRDPQVRELRADSVSMTLDVGTPGRGLAATRYGQQVAQMDPTGALELAMLPMKRATIKVD